MFRAMRLEIDGLPRLGRSAREFGVRINVDLPVGADGSVEPGTGGMSVAVDNALNLPKHRRPRSLGGEGRDPVFGLETSRIALGLAINWGLRFLCAYALECEGLELLPGRRDLAWIAELLRPVVDSGTSGLQAGH